MPTRHVRGYIRSINAHPAPGNPGQLAVELWLTDRRNVSQHVRWRARHYDGGAVVANLDVQPGDDVEVRLIADTRNGYADKSCIINHTRGRQYVLNARRKRWWIFGA